MTGIIKMSKRELFRNNLCKRDIFNICIEFVLASCSLFLFADCMAATQTQMASVLAPVKPEINEFVDFWVVITWIVGISFGGYQGFKGNLMIAGVTALVIPAIVTAVLIAHKF